MGFNVGRYNLTDDTIAPVASYTGDKNFGIVPFTVQFTSTSINEPIVYHWDFGDGTTSNEQNPSHEYLISGSFNVTLLTVNRGGSNFKTNEGFVYAISKPPIADFTSDVQTGDIPLTITFTDTSTNVPTSWLWDFGDGNTSSSQNPTHTYQDSGRFTVTLTVSNGGGEDTKSVYNYINAIGIPPIADFSTDAITGYKPVTIQFTDTSTSYPTKYEWNFGDTNCGNDITKINDSNPPYHTYDSAEINPSYLYEGVGVFHPTLTVSNNSGSDTISKTITILDSIPTCTFTQSIEGWKVTTTDTTTGYPTTLIWEWGDGTTTVEYRSPNSISKWDSATKTRSHMYTSPGTYQITLTVSNTAGIDDFDGASFTVDYTIPVAAFTSNTIKGYVPAMAVQFYDQSTEKPTSWLWNFGDGTTSTEQNPFHVYENVTPTTYTVTLTATSSKGSDAETKTAYISLVSKVGITIVAANDSDPTEKFYADYVCDSSNTNQITINAATSVGGTVVLLEGTFNCNDNIKAVDCVLIGSGINKTIINTSAYVHVSNASDFSLIGSGVIKTTLYNPVSYSLARITATDGEHVSLTPKIQIDALTDVMGTVTTTTYISNTYSTWSKCAEISIVNPPALDGYQILVSVSYLTGMKTDFADIRFTTTDDVALPYCVESQTDGSSALVWVKVASGTSTIRMFYGNTNAVSESSGVDVFDYYDNFSSGILDSKWHTISGASISNDNLEITAAPGVFAAIALNTSLSAPYRVITRTKTTTTVGSTVGFGFGVHQSVNTLYVGTGCNGYRVNESDTAVHGANIQKYTGSWTNLSQVAYSLPINTYYRAVLSCLNSGTTIKLEFQPDGGGTSLVAASTTDTTYTAGYLSLMSYSGTALYDFIAVGKYLAIEPVCTIGTPVSNATSTSVETNVTLDTIMVNNVASDGFYVSSVGKTIALNIVNCSAIGCGGNGFNLFNGVNYNSIAISDCIADDNYLNGFYFELPPAYNYITNILMERCVATNNGLRKYNSPSGVGFLFVDKSYYKNYYNKQTQTLSYKPYALIKNCVSQNNATANYASYGYGTNTSPMIIQDCKSVGSKTSVIIDNHNGIIFNRFISDGANEDILRTYGVSDIEFMDGTTTFTAPNTFSITIPVDTYGLRIINAPNNISDVQLNLSNADYNNLSAQLKTIIVMED